MRERLMDRQELVRRLRLPPRTVRRLIQEYREWLSAPDSGRFTALDVARLQIAARLTLAGKSTQAVLEALQATRRDDADDRTKPRVPSEARRGNAQLGEAGRGEAGAAPGHAEAAAASAPEPLADEIGRLREAILRSAERERQDRDRVVMALVRTQQEVSQLRSEIGTLRSRRDRRRGMIRRLFS